MGVCSVAGGRGCPPDAVIRAAGRSLVAVVCALVPGLASATFGVYPSGDGIVSMGLGGISQVVAQETYTMAANPALATTLGKRFDVGTDYMMPYPQSRIHDSALGPNETYSSSKNVVPIPQFGYVTPLTDRVSVGVTGFAAGFGTDYRHGFLSRFGGPQRSSVSMLLSGVSNVLAWRLNDRHSLGASFNVSYQTLETSGLTPFQGVSQDPLRVTDNGTDGAFGVSFTLGWHAQLLPRLEAGASYRSRIWAQRFQEYAGMLPQHGRVSLPARMGLGIAYRPLDPLTIAVEYQRIPWAQEKLTGNSFAELADNGHLLGTSEGPGFGWDNQNNFKFGIQWRQSPAWAFRAGYSWSSGLAGRRETLFNTFAPTTLRQHFTVGSSYTLPSGWSVTGYAGLAQRTEVKGHNSIPAAFGGGEVNSNQRVPSVGVSLGRSFR